MTISETLDIIKLELAQNTYGKRKIEIHLPISTFYSFAKYIQFCIKYNEKESNRFVDCSKWNSYNVKINGKKFLFKKKIK